MGEREASDIAAALPAGLPDGHRYGVVESTAWLTPSIVRVRLGGDGLAGFASTGFTDEYVNCRFVPPGAPYAAPFGEAATAAAAPEHRPRARRYTVRAWDPGAPSLTIDFVVHGDAGHAGPWAQRAQPGEVLQFSGPTGGYRPDPAADWHLFAGDESALPAIAASLETIAPGRRCAVFVVVDDADHEVALTSPGDLEVHWLHRATAAAPEALLPDAVAALDWPAGRPDVFVHGEAGEVRATRRHLVAARGVAVDAASISPYWRRDHDDEAWRRIKRQWLAEQAADL